MTKFKKFLKSPVSVIVLFLVAAALIIGGGIGGTIAWNNDPIFSDTYSSRVEMREIGVTLNENHEMVSHRDYVRDSDYQWDTSGSTYRLCDNLLGTGDNADKELKIGKKYSEPLSVTNSGYIDEYVKVNVYKYWAEVDDKGNVTKKRTDLDPSFIELHFTKDGWIEDPRTKKDEERTTLYYTGILTQGQESPLFADAVTIKDDVSKKVVQHVTKQGEYTVYTNVYEYDEASFIIEVEADAVQTHNAQEAILSAWGVHASISNGVITGIR